MNRISNIIIFTSSYPYGSGEQFIEDELRQFVNKGYHIVLQPYYYANNKVPRKTVNGIKVKKPLAVLRMPSKYLVVWRITIGLVLYAMKDLVLSIYKGNLKGLRWRLRQLLIAILGTSGIKIEKDDLLYFYWGTGAAFYIPFLKKGFTNKILCRFHGGDLYEELHDGGLPLQEKIVKAADICVTVSDVGKRYLENKYKKEIICNKLGTTNIMGLGKPSEDGVFRIVSCSSIIPIKRVDLIAQVIIGLGEKYEWIHFGDGPDRLLVEKVLFEKQNCTIAGVKSRNEIMKYYYENPCDLFINLSETEGIPVSVMEAYSFGIPAIGTNVGGMKEIILPELLVNENSNMEVIINKVKNFREIWLKDKSYLRNKVRVSWELNFSSERNFNKLEKIINEQLL